MPVFEKTTFSPSAHTRNAPPLPDSLMQSNQPCRPPTTSCSPHDPLSRYPTAPLCKAGKPTNQPPLCKAGKTHKSAPLVQRGEVKGGLSPRLPLPVKIAPLSLPPLHAASPYHKGRHENGA